MICMAELDVQRLPDRMPPAVVKVEIGTPENSKTENVLDAISRDLRITFAAIKNGKQQK